MSNGQHAPAPTLEGQLGLVERVSEVRATRPQAIAEALSSDDPDALMRAVAIASGLGVTSAYTWLKLPAVADMRRVLTATTLPTVLATRVVA